jgi:hypothetical protein
LADSELTSWLPHGVELPSSMDADNVLVVEGGVDECVHPRF